MRETKCVLVVNTNAAENDALLGHGGPALHQELGHLRSTELGRLRQRRRGAHLDEPNLLPRGIQVQALVLAAVVEHGLLVRELRRAVVLLEARRERIQRKRHSTQNAKGNRSISPRCLSPASRSRRWTAC